MIWPLLRTRRWLAFTALVVGVIIAFGLLSRWQWARAELHHREKAALDAALAATPQPLDPDLIPQEWRPTTVTGRYDAANEVLVRRRPLNATNGFWVLTPLSGDAGTVWINRGWIPVGGDALATPSVPAPPTGTVTVTGYARAYESAEPDANAGLPAGQVAAAAASLLPAAADVAPVYVQLATSDPEQAGLVPWPLPEQDVDESRNISYAVQWALFALVAMGGWYFFLRREAKEDAAKAASTPPDDAPATPQGAPEGNH